MLTVILFHELNKELLLKYQFIFVNFQADHQIALCEWGDGMKEEDVYQRLDSLTSEHHEWKLLIFGGRLPAGGPRSRNGDLSAADLPDYRRLLEIYTDSPRKSRARHTVKGFLPVAVWFVGFQEKRIWMRSGASAFRTVDRAREFGSTFRAIWFEVDNSSKMQAQFDLFRMTCGILVLALNDIPSYYLEFGYLYQMDVTVHRSDFAEYVVLLQEQLRQIGDLIRSAQKDLEKDYQTQAAYPGAALKKSSLTQNRQKLVGNVAREKIAARDLAEGFSLENKLDTNRRWLRAQLYFPKGILQQELEKMQAGVDAAPGAGYRLNEAARDRVEREQQSALDKLRTQRKKKSRLNQTLNKVKVLERDMLLKKERWQWGGEKWVVLAALSAAEILLLLPFCLTALYTNHFPDWQRGLLLFLLLAGVPACFCGLFCLISRLDFISAAGSYEGMLKRDIDGVQKEQLRYMEDTMNLIAEYQYGVRLQKEDLGRLAALEQRKKTLRRHSGTLENGRFVCQQLSVLLGEEELKPPQSVSCPSIDFTDDPNEVEYYWVPYRHSMNMANLNESGHMVNTFFSFVSKITLRKTPYADEGRPLHL